MFFSCNSCKEEDCGKFVYIQNNTNEDKVIWVSVFYPDTTYQCMNQKNGLPPYERIELSFGQPSTSCWDYELENKSLQVFVLDSIVYADSTCEAIKANPQLYERMEFTLDELKSQNWVVSVD